MIKKIEKIKNQNLKYALKFIFFCRSSTISAGKEK